jgi:hypothetical protein
MMLPREIMLLRHALAALNAVEPFGYDGAAGKGHRRRALITPHLTYQLAAAIEAYLASRGYEPYAAATNAALDYDPKS